MIEGIAIKDLYDLNETIASEVFLGLDYPWQALPIIASFVLQIGKTLPSEEYDHPAEDVWIERTAKIYPSAYVHGPCIICSHAEIRHCAFIRGAAIVGEYAIVGNSTELKNVILFNRVQVPHYNYVGDSILGYKAHMGAGSITSNIKSDKTSVSIRVNDEIVSTGLKKVGAFLGDYVEVGCNAVLNPGAIVGKNSSIYPLSSVRGFVPADSIFKQNHIASKKSN